MPEKAVYVHIGPLKTGTTYLQSVLQANASTLAEQRVLFPRGTYGRQVRSVLDLLDRRPAGRAVRGQWQDLVEEVHAWDGDRAIISQEFLCTATSKQTRRLVETLAPAEVHVIYTARELSRVIPAAWQTLIRNGHFITWTEFIAAVRDPQLSTNSTGKHFWRQQNPAQVLANWGSAVAERNIHIVTVPSPGSSPELLWERFCCACGLNPENYNTDVPRTNLSLGAAETEALRRLNEAVVERLRHREVNRWVKYFLSREVLEKRRNSIKLALPQEEYPWVAARSKEMIDFLAAHDYDVVGDLEDLRTGEPPATLVTRPDEVNPSAVLDATSEMLAELLVEAQRRLRKSKTSRKRASGRDSRFDRAAVARRVKAAFRS